MGSKRSIVTNDNPICKSTIATLKCELIILLPNISLQISISSCSYPPT